jgi:methionyl-tRNA synthetase
LLAYLKNHPDCVTPSFRQTELINAVEKISGDLCISRPKSRLNWGIELPFDKDFVNYVWFDALTNYISFVGYDPKIDYYEKQPLEFRNKWPALQIIGKDILIPAHGVYWMIMLRALGFPDTAMPRFLVHGWWNLGGAKMSKTAGNVVDPSALADEYGAEALRYYLMSDIATGSDADFSEARLVNRYNSDLANSLGNLLNRTLNMAVRYRDGRLKLVRAETPTGDEGIFDTIEGFHTGNGFVNLGDERVAKMPNACRAYIGMFDAYLVNAGIMHVFEYATSCNQLIDSRAPWKLAKDESKHRELDAVLYHLSESLRIIAILISPVLPKAAHGIFDQLNWKMELSGKEERFRLDDAKRGGLPDGHTVGKPVPLFPRIEG